MKNAMKFLTFVLMALALVVTSCSPEDGENGADGMDGINGVDGQNGADGTDGTDGQDGEDGEDGEDGNANVFSSDWIEYDVAVWSDVSSEFGVEYRNYPVIAAEITQDIVDSGVVLAYSRFVITSTQVYALPFTENITGADPEGQTISYRFELNDLTLKMRNVTGSGDPGTFGGAGIAEFRYIVIPSQGLTSGNGRSVQDHLASEGVDINNYREVMAYFDLD